MDKRASYYSLYLSGLIVFLSVIALLINYFIYQFPGNNFFPEDMLLLTSIIVIVNAGLFILFGKESRLSHSGVEFFYFFGMMSVIAFATNAIQLTPFPVIDKEILSLEHYFNINIPEILIWTSSHPYFKSLLGIVYDSLPYQMALLPLIVIAAGKFSLIREYYFLMLFSALLGFVFYYFFPTAAPASIMKSLLFSPEQVATGLKFYQIHHHIKPTTQDGGLIALPSFHTIWALMGVYLLKDWTIPCLFLLIINLLLIISCVLLGWHYVTDVVAALATLAISFGFLRVIKIKTINSEH